ncbi:MAG: hypothetical protein Q9217_000258 [Psora testacea]
MEHIPPSYEAAIARDPWQVVANYIPSSSLCALTRVNRNFHRRFSPLLWGNPAAHFTGDSDDLGSDLGDRIFDALTRFRRSLKRVRLCVRELTHTLRLPPAEAELYDGPRPEWFRDILEQLPNLQSLIVSRLPFFDHSALLALQRPSSNRGSMPSIHGPIFPLRLLIATGCQNTTSQGLGEALDHFPNLVYLDLSHTLAARDGAVISKLLNLPLLQTLKLRGVHLRDEDLRVTAQAVGIRLRSLDVRDNNLTDQSIRALLSCCFIPEAPSSSIYSHERSHSSLSIAVEDWPTGFPPPDPTVFDEFQDELYDERLVRRLTSNLVSRLPFEDLPHSGITHLRVSENNLSVEGIAALIRSKQLCVLDVGSVSVHELLRRAPSRSSSISRALHDRHIRRPGVQELAPLLGHCAQGLTSLRIDHTLVTEEVPLQDDRSPSVFGDLDINEGNSELEEPVPPIYELDGSQPRLYEFDSQKVEPKYSLTGDVNHCAHQHIRQKPQASDSIELGRRRGSFVAPGAIQGSSEGDGDDGDQPVLSWTGPSPSAQGINGINGITNLLDSFTDTSERNPTHCDVGMSVAYIAKQRNALRMRQSSNARGLTPGMLPKLRSLVLTEVPCYEKSRKVIDALILFVKDCAAEAQLAFLQARLAPRTGRVRTLDHRYTTRAIFALQRIVLEMAPDEPLNATSTLSSHLVKPSKFVNRTKSSTEDADSEALWTASENDFTFFDADKECGLPAAEGTTCGPYSTMSEGITVSKGNSDNGHRGIPQQLNHKGPAIDVVKELADFRRERKNAYENALKRGLKHVDGYWPGEVKIVRGQGFCR